MEPGKHSATIMELLGQVNQQMNTSVTIVEPLGTVDEQKPQIPLFETSEPLADDIRIVKVEPEDNPEDFLLAYDCTAEGSLRCRDPSAGLWAPLFSGEAQPSYQGSSPHYTTDDYDRFNDPMIDNLHATEEHYRKRFRSLPFSKEARPRTVAYQLHDWCSKWLKPEIRSPAQIIELIVVEQLIQILPAGAGELLSHLQVRSVDDAVLLIEGYMAGEAAKGGSADVLSHACKEEKLTEELGLRVKKKCKKTKPKACISEMEPHQTPSCKAQEMCKSSEQEACTNENMSQTRQRNPAGNEAYQCKACGKRFRKYSNVLKHQKIHTGESVYVCVECGKSFGQSTEWINHQKIHTSKTPFACNECGKKFCQPRALRNHQLMHKEDKPFPCDVCGKSFLRLSLLLSHQKVHTGEKSVSCTECGKSFSWSSVLKKHQRIHTGEKPYTCKECGKSFNQSSTLIRHKQTHIL